MPAGSEEHRNDPEFPDPFRVERVNAISKRRLHQLQEGERDALARKPLGEL